MAIRALADLLKVKETGGIEFLNASMESIQGYCKYPKLQKYSKIKECGFPRSILIKLEITERNNGRP
jgi:hypothetical protein